MSAIDDLHREIYLELIKVELKLLQNFLASGAVKKFYAPIDDNGPWRIHHLDNMENECG